MEQSRNPNSQTKILLWTVWVFVFVSILLYKFYLGSGLEAPEESQGSHAMGVAIPMSLLLGASLMAVFMRLLLVPKARTRGQYIASYIIGLFIAESTAFYVLFLLPQMENTLYLFPLFNVLIYIPLSLSAPEEAK